ncbi:MAG: DUF721 domain-containing protein [Paracoccaceae bacterium]|nr:DUF721 domain-containing protein [Paracoccaceae bacterium]
MAQPEDRRERRSRGFERASGLVASRVRKAGEGRGFAVAKVLTHWSEIVGTEIAALARPVKVSYGREGFGATLTLLCAGAAAPMVQMRLEEIREKVNACYGYAAISRLKVTQTSAEGFAEAPAAFEPAPKAPRPEAEAEAREAAGDVEDPGLRAALELLGRNVLSKN